MGYIFSAAFMANMLSMTAMLIFLSVAGMSNMAADLAIVQASTSALFYAFSANTRNIVLATSTAGLARSLLNIRVLLLVPLVLAAFWLNSTLGNVESTFAAILILRRTIEWFGEVDLSERERLGDQRFALVYVAVQAVLFAFAVLWMLLDESYPLFGLFLWALIPLMLSVKFFWFALGDFANVLSSVNKKIAPHFGSTLVIGVSLYVFRLLMILMLGKNISGDMFAAFAIGGVLGALTVTAFGPSIAFNEKLHGTFKFPKLLTALLWFFLGAGSLIVGWVILNPEPLLWLGKGQIFWQALGFSMIGGVVMTHAQLLRNRLLIHNENHDLFGPDLLMNILIIAAMPITFFTLGIEAVAALSLLGAVLAFAFYKSSELTEIIGETKYTVLLKYIQILIGFFILMPVFITLDSGIYLINEMQMAVRHSLMTLPIPPSIFLTYIAILVIGSYRSVHLSLSVVFFTFILMCFSTLILADNQGSLERAKIILIIQYTLPMGALVLGEMFKTKFLDDNFSIERAFLVVLTVIVPLQLAATWWQGNLQLTSYVFIFSIYQHVHYVHTIFVSAFLLVIFSLWPDDRYRNMLIIISLFMGIYAAASTSLIAIAYLIAGLLVFAVFRWRVASEKSPAILLAAVTSICLVYLGMEISAMRNFNKFEDVIFETLSSWRLYITEIGDSAKSIFLGHARALDNAKFPSTHNYYLDMSHSFGVIALGPLLIAILYTVRATYFVRKQIIVNATLSGHLLVLFVLLIIDNSVQVSLRQPYSGIFTYFVWGLFLARLSRIANVKDKFVGVEDGEAHASIHKMQKIS